MESQRTITIDSDALNTLEQAIGKIEEGRAVIQSYSEVIGGIDKKDLKVKIIANLNRQLHTVTEQIQAIGLEADDGLTKIEKRVKKLQRRGFWNTVNNLITASAVGASIYLYFNPINIKNVENAQLLEKYHIELKVGEKQGQGVVYVGAHGAEAHNSNGNGYLIFRGK